MNLQAAVVQYAPTNDRHQNIETIQTLVTTAADQGAEVVVLPEYATFTNPTVDYSFVENAEPLNGPSVTALRQLSTETGVTIIAGVNEPDGHGRIYNTLVGIQDDEIVAEYRKLHLYDAFGMQESQWVTRGAITAPQLLNVNGFMLGLQTCYDLRFPEVSRMLVDAGADVLVVPAAWVPGPLKEFHWTTLLQARAIENTTYVLAADQATPTGIGHSMIIDPMGIQRAMIGDEAGIARGQLERQRLEAVREINPALQLRRFFVHHEREPRASEQT